MSRLAEFLRTERDRLKSQAEERKPRIVEWVGAVGCLVQRMKEWIRETDHEGILSVTENAVSLEEEGLPPTSVPALDVRFGKRHVQVVPRSYNVAATLELPDGGEPRRAAGRVDVTDGTIRWVLYRIPDEHGERWFWDAESGVKLLDRDVFEQMLLGLLQ
jgi:hypothetical protein